MIVSIKIQTQRNTIKNILTKKTCNFCHLAVDLSHVKYDLATSVPILKRKVGLCCRQNGVLFMPQNGIPFTSRTRPETHLEKIQKQCPLFLYALKTSVCVQIAKSIKWHFCISCMF